ncbi:MAG: hypothetical protein GY703_16700 [Gammaproteobacteria bacterium]|nr:hypothetical protein [Gammaproteobacteria bacterium]
MNKSERLKSHHLNLCTFRHGSWEQRFCRNLSFAAENDPHSPLTPKQKWCLDYMAHRFRRQLAATMPKELMVYETPDRRDYGIDDENKTAGTVDDLFSGKPSAPHPTQSDDHETHPQKNLI